MNDHVTLPASVQRFQPEATDYTERVHKRGSPSVAMEPFDAMGVVADGATLESAEAWTLFRATRVADARNVYQAIEGAEFSADLGRVSAAEPFGLIAGEWRHLADVDPESPGHGTVRPEAIELRCTIEQLGQTRALTLATDVAIEYDHPDAAWLSKDSARPVLTATNVAIGRGEMPWPQPTACASRCTASRSTARREHRIVERHLRPGLPRRPWVSCGARRAARRGTGAAGAAGRGPRLRRGDHRAAAARSEHRRRAGQRERGEPEVGSGGLADAGVRGGADGCATGRRGGCRVAHRAA